MTKAKKAAAKKEQEPTRPSKNRPARVSEGAKKAEAVQKVRNQVRNVIVDNSLEMTKRLVRTVSESGNVAALKYLWEVSGLFPSDEENAEVADDSLAKILLRRLGPAAGSEGESESSTVAESDVESEDAPEAREGRSQIEDCKSRE